MPTVPDQGLWIITQALLGMWTVALGRQRMTEAMLAARPSFQISILQVRRARVL
ncbi:hypothetical protein D3C86_2159630 [compost metagenome]